MSTPMVKQVPLRVSKQVGVWLIGEETVISAYVIDNEHFTEIFLTELIFQLDSLIK